MMSCKRTRAEGVRQARVVVVVVGRGEEGTPLISLPSPQLVGSRGKRGFGGRSMGHVDGGQAEHRDAALDTDREGAVCAADEHACGRYVRRVSLRGRQSTTRLLMRRGSTVLLGVWMAIWIGWCCGWLDGDLGVDNALGSMEAAVPASMSNRSKSFQSIVSKKRSRFCSGVTFASGSAGSARAICSQISKEGGCLRRRGTGRR